MAKATVGRVQLLHLKCKGIADLEATSEEGEGGVALGGVGVAFNTLDGQKK